MSLKMILYTTQNKEVKRLRFYLQFKIERPELPIEFRRCILSFIKNALSKEQDGRFFDMYYKDTIQKDFSWSIIMGSPSFQKDKVVLNHNMIKVNFTTDDRNNTGFVLFNTFLKQRNTKYPIGNGNFMTLINVGQNQQKIISSKSCIFKTACGSPLCLRAHNKETNKDTYYVGSDSDFNEMAVDGIKRQLENAGFDLSSFDLQFKWLQGKKVVVSHYGVKIDASVGAFMLSAPEEILQYIYQTGVLSRKSEGFGMIDLVAQNI